MNYWLLISTLDNGSIIENNLIYGVSKKNFNSMKRIEIGDECLLYIRQAIIDKNIIEPKIHGRFIVESPMYEDVNSLFITQNLPENEIYPIRIRLRKHTIFNPPVEFKSLIANLDFITNKKNWAAHLQGIPIKKIPKEDFETVINSYINSKKVM